MDDLSAEDRALLDRARNAHEPSDADRRRLRAALAASIGAASGLATATAVAKTSSVGAAGAAGSAAITTKVIAAVVVASAVGGGGVVAYKRMPVKKPPAAHVAHVDRVRTGEFNAHPQLQVQGQEDLPPLPQGVPPVEIAPPPVVTTPAVAADVRPARPSKRARMPAPAAAPPQIQKQEEQEQEKQEQAPATPAPTPSSTEAETWLIRKGVAALHAGDPARALALFDEHARHFPDGLLAEERAAERIIALHDLGRDAEARAAATAFLRAHPGSPQAERVRAACDMPPNQ